MHQYSSSTSASATQNGSTSYDFLTEISQTNFVSQCASPGPELNPANYWLNYAASSDMTSCPMVALDNSDMLLVAKQQQQHHHNRGNTKDPFNYPVPVPLSSYPSAPSYHGHLVQGQPGPQGQPHFSNHFSCAQSFIRRRNERERERVRYVNEGYDTLRRCLPLPNREKRISKVEILRSAIRYIGALEKILQTDDNGGCDEDTESLALLLAGSVARQSGTGSSGKKWKSGDMKKSALV